MQDYLDKLEVVEYAVFYTEKRGCKLRSVFKSDEYLGKNNVV